MSHVTRLFAAIAASISVAVLVSGCVGAPTIDVDVSVAPIRLDEAPADTGSIVTGSGEVLGDLSELLPQVEAVVSDVLESETAWGRELRASAGVAGSEPAALGSPRGERGMARAAGGDAVTGEYYLAGMMINGFLMSSLQGSKEARDFTTGVVNGSSAAGQAGPAATDGGLTVTKTGKNSLSISIVSATNTTKDGVTVAVKHSMGVEGTICPGDDGVFDFTTKVGNGAAGSAADGSASVEQELTVHVTGRLGENGYPESLTMTGTQGTRRTSADGTSIYVETRHTQTGTTLEGLFTLGNTAPEVVRTSSGATDADIRSIAERSGARVSAFGAGTALGTISGMWNGGCVAIEAPGPGSVESYTTSTIPVTTTSKLSGESFPSQVTAALSGEKSIDKTKLTTPGEITHEAGGYGASGTIALAAASRRGTATASVAITVTGGAYSASGGGGEFSGSGTICDISKPFVIGGSGVIITFIPSGPGGGSYSYAGSIGGFAVSGGESYTVNYLGDVAVSIDGRGVGTVQTPIGPVSGNGTEKYVLVPLEQTPPECGS